MIRQRIISRICLRCGNSWQQSYTTVFPKVCPKCRSRYWDRIRKDKKGEL